MKQKISIIIIAILSTLFPKCKYIGGYDIVKGSKAIKEIKEKITSYSSIGTLYTLSAATTSFTCPSSSSATIVKEAEPNNTYKYANKFDFLSPTQSTRLQGTITTGNSDYDIFYMAVPSDTTYTKFYYKGVKSSGACGININSDGSELSNDTTTYNNKVTRYIGDVRTDKVFSQEIKPSEYIFFFCNTAGDGISYDIELSLTDIGSSSSSTDLSSLSSVESTLSSFTFGPTVFEISSGIDKNRYYTQASLDECLKKIKTAVPAASLLDSYNYLLYLKCGAASYTPVNPYFVAGYECKLQEADWIQIGDFGGAAVIPRQLDANSYLVRVNQPATEGKANKAVVDAISEYFHVPKSKITILKVSVKQNAIKSRGFLD